MYSLYQIPIEQLKGVGEKRAGLLRRLGADSVGALLRFFPRDYIDWSNHTTVLDADSDSTVFIRAEIFGAPQESRLPGNRFVSTFRAYDEGGTALHITFFNNRFISRSLHSGQTYVFRGKLTYFNSVPQLASPDFLPAEKANGIMPVYPCTPGITSQQTGRLVLEALRSYGKEIVDPLSADVRERCSLCAYSDALRYIHSPQNHQEVELARRRLIFDELLLLQLGLMRIKNKNRSASGAAIRHDYCAQFFSTLPFEPTGAQVRAAEEAVRDMMSDTPMARLLQGDVGSGKTAVAAALCFTAAKNGYQSALMAPTELLAEQHYSTLRAMLEPAGIRTVLLTGSLSAAQKREVYALIEQGETDVVVGTHALITDKVHFSALGLAIVDEQHRFGVQQRTALSSKGLEPHTLVMSATPIPRTLALMLYGDLDVSVLDEMPKGRIPVETFHVTGAYHERIYAFIRKHATEGRQTFIVCPLVEENDTDLQSAQEYAAKLSSGELRDCSVGLLHGRMKAADKENIMRKFCAGEISVLVSTTVIEVGVDVPGAAIMVVENAERFGLAQLHQLRGRVGRGGGKAYCILVSDAKGETARSRLATMCSTTDGFKISEEDLRLRGPGDFFGSMQHGLPRLDIADLATDTALLNLSAAEAARIIRHDPSLSAPEHAQLLLAIAHLFRSVYALN